MEEDLVCFCIGWRMLARLTVMIHKTENLKDHLKFCTHHDNKRYPARARFYNTVPTDSPIPRTHPVSLARPVAREPLQGPASFPYLCPLSDWTRSNEASSLSLATTDSELHILLISCARGETGHPCFEMPRIILLSMCCIGCASSATLQDCQAPASKADCGYSGIDQAGCEAKGCCWLPVSLPCPWEPLTASNLFGAGGRARRRRTWCCSWGHGQA